MVTDRQDSRECLDNKVAVLFVGEGIASHVGSDVQEQLVEVGDLEQLVERDQLQVGDALLADKRRRRSVWQGATRILLDFRQLLLAGVGQSIRQLSLDFCGSSGCCTNKRDHAQQSDGSSVETHIDILKK